jgi:hypothetical protein
VERVGIELSQGSTLTDWAASALGVPATAAGIALSMVIGGGLIFWASRERSFRHPENYIAGVGIGGAVIAMWWVSGNLGHVVEHPETLQESLSCDEQRAHGGAFFHGAHGLCAGLDHPVQR